MTTHTQTSRPRIAIGGIVHESNSFFSVNTTLADFDQRTGDNPDTALEQWGKNNDEVSGFIEGGARFGLDFYPTLVAHATPSGPVTDEALNALTGDLLRRIRSGGNFEGLLLALHGAMVAESYLHADGEVVRRLREALGSGFPIVVTHDFHANISSQVVELSTALLNYKTNPHIDQKDRGIRAAWIMSGIVSGKFKPVQALAKPGMIYNIRFQNTNAEPLAPIVEQTRRLEEQDGILAASVAGGYQYADVPAMGASVVVVTNNDRELAERAAKRLSGELWNTRDRLALRLPDPAASVRQAISSDRFPVVLVEMGDNIGGGASGDATFLLGELVRQKASGWFVALADPRAAEAAAQAGIGGAFDMEVGAKTDRLHGDPVRIRGRVKSLHDGRFMETAVRHGGQRYYNQGLTAVIEAEDSTPDNQNLVMLTARRQVPFSLHQLIANGIYPERQRILVVKAAVAFRAAYEPVAGSIIEVDTPGVTAVNPRRFTWKHVDPNLFGLEP